MTTPGVHAIIATSGTSRAESLGTPWPVCHAGLEKLSLAPPPLDPQALSIPPGAVPTTLVSSPKASNCGLKVVPPTPGTWGLAASSLTFCVVPVTQELLVASYCRPAAPQSPEPVNTDWPWAAACANSVSSPVK